MGIGSALANFSALGTGLMAFEGYTNEQFTAAQLNEIFTALNAQFNVTFVLSVLGAIIGAAAALVAMWWGARKGVRMLMSAFKRGKLRI